MQWKEMRADNYEFLYTSRLQQDPLENLFAALRGRSGHNPNPTVRQLRCSLQYTITTNLKSTSHLTNCETDETIALLSILGNIEESVDSFETQQVMDEELNEAANLNENQSNNIHHLHNSLSMNSELDHINQNPAVVQQKIIFDNILFNKNHTNSYMCTKKMLLDT